MDIHYCDSCGEIVEGAAPEGGFGARQVLCSKCGGSQLSTSGSRPASASNPMETEVVDDRGLDVELNLRSMLEGDDLDLFSADTIARKKSNPTKSKSSTKLKLVDPNDTVFAPKQIKKAKTEVTPPAPMGLQSALDAAFAGPPSPTARRGGTATQTATQVKLKDSAPSRTPIPPGGQVARQENWRLACPSCEGRLSLKPVMQRSKLRCPRCTEVLVVETTGHLWVPKERNAGHGSGRVAHVDTASQATQPLGAIVDSVVPRPAARAAPPQIVRPAPAQPAARPPSTALGKSGARAPQHAHVHQDVTEELAPAFPKLGPALLQEEEPAFDRRQLRTDAQVSFITVGVWLFVATLPSFIGLFLASGFLNAPIPEMIETVGASIVDTVQSFYQALGR